MAVTFFRHSLVIFFLNKYYCISIEVLNSITKESRILIRKKEKKNNFKLTM